MGKLNIFYILEQCDRRLHAKIVHNSLHLLYPRLFQKLKSTPKRYVHNPRQDLGLIQNDLRIVFLID